ncbi:MAG: hypothetical protein AAF916_10835 [Planctomycetota bacterium]
MNTAGTVPDAFDLVMARQRVRMSRPDAQTQASAERLLAKLRRVDPSPFLIHAADADAALLLDARGLAELDRHPVRSVLVLRLVEEGDEHGR